MPYRQKVVTTNIPLGTSGVFTTPDIISQLFTQASIILNADQNGTLVVQVFNEAANAYQNNSSVAFIANTPMSQIFTFVGIKFRLVYTNGAIAQTIFNLVSYIS